MPRFDRTGPKGQGSRTGRGMGKCNPDNQKANEQVDANESPEELDNKSGGGKGRRSRFGKGAGRGLVRRLRRGNS